MLKKILEKDIDIISKKLDKDNDFSPENLFKTIINLEQLQNIDKQPNNYMFPSEKEILEKTNNKINKTNIIDDFKIKIKDNLYKISLIEYQIDNIFNCLYLLKIENTEFPKPQIYNHLKIKKDIKFKCYIPALNIMIEDFAIYSNNDIGVSTDVIYDEFKKNNITYFIDFDLESIIHEDLDNDISEKIVSFMSIGDDYIEFDSSNIEIIEYTTFKDNKNIGQELYDKDIVKVNNYYDGDYHYKEFIGIIEWIDGEWIISDIEETNNFVTLWHYVFNYCGGKIGNAYLNPELLIYNPDFDYTPPIID